MRAPGETLRYEGGPSGKSAVVLVAGVPGAGKSSLLRRLAAETTGPAGGAHAGIPGTAPDDGAPGAAPDDGEPGTAPHAGEAAPAPRIVDSDQVRALLPRPFTGGPGYLLTRGPVYLLHWIRIALAMAAPADVPVFVHDPATRSWTRHLVALLARLNGRPVHLLWVVAEPEQARAGQRQRGRRLPTATQLRHEQRQQRIRAGLAAGTVRFPGFASARFVTRDEAADLHVVFPEPAPEEAPAGRVARGRRRRREGLPAATPAPSRGSGRRDNTGPQPVTTSGPAA